MSLPQLPSDGSWDEQHQNSLIYHNLLNSDPLNSTGMAPQFGDADMSFLNGHSDLSFLSPLPQPNLQRTSRQAQLPSNLSAPDALEPHDSYSKIFGGQFLGPALSQSHTISQGSGLANGASLGLDSLVSSGNGQYAHMQGAETGPYMQLTDLARLSSESTPAANFLAELRRGSLDATYSGDNQVPQHFAHLNRHSLGSVQPHATHTNDLQANQHYARLNRHSWGQSLATEPQNSHPSQAFARLQRTSGSSLGHDGPNLDQSLARLNRRSLGGSFANDQELWERQRHGSLPRAPKQEIQQQPAELYPYDSSRRGPDLVGWSDRDGSTQAAPAASMMPPAGQLGGQPSASQPAANPQTGARTQSGNSLDSSPDFTGNWEDPLLNSSAQNREERPPCVEDMQKQREKNRNAQKRFRQRQKERMKDSQQQMEALTQQMNRLMQEKAELETRNRILEQVVRLNVEHVDQLQSNKEVLNIEQMMLLENYTEFISKVKGEPKASVETAKKWLLGDLIIHDFQLFITKIRELHAQAVTFQSSEALEQLNDLIILRREHERQGALFSCFYWAIYCWNVEETRKRAVEQPTLAKWQQILDNLNLTEDQRKEMLNARRRMLSRLNDLVDTRRSLISQLGLELLQTGREKLHTCPAIQELRASMEAEREAVFNFLFTAVDETLTPAQEAFLDFSSYPWCPDIWTLTTILAQRHKEPQVPIPNLEMSSAVLDPILPHSTAFKLLITPITAVGIGLRLKRGLAMCKTQGVLPKSAYPLLSQKQLASRTFLEVQCGKWKKFSTRDWQTRCLLADNIVSNALDSKDDGYISP